MRKKFQFSELLQVRGERLLKEFLDALGLPASRVLVVRRAPEAQLAAGAAGGPARRRRRQRPSPPQAGIFRCLDSRNDRFLTRNLHVSHTVCCELGKRLSLSETHRMGVITHHP